MTKEEILGTLRELKPKYEAEGFEILGLFGSYARDEATESSDVDILYKIPNMTEYLQKHSGWNAINRIVEAKESLSQTLHKKVDFVDIETLNSVGKKYILADVVYV
jgi:uncharacterized protein